MAEDLGSMKVAGESWEDLRRALSYVQVPDPSDPKNRVNGLVKFSAVFPADVAPALLRALMRIEAELLLHDADRIGERAIEPRTHDQRRADAFVALALRVADAAGF